MGRFSILLVGRYYYIYGGAERYQIELERLLSDTIADVIPFSTKSEKNIYTPYSRYFARTINFRNPGLPDPINYIYSFWAKGAISQLISQFKTDIAHLNVYHGQLTSSIISPLAQAGIPIVHTLHDYKQVCAAGTLYSQGRVCQSCNGSRFWMASLKRCRRGVAKSVLSSIEAYVSRLNGDIKKIDRFISPSQFLAQKVIELGIPREKVSVINNFLDCSGIQPSLQNDGYFLYFGRLDRTKGILTLAEAFKELPKLKLLIAGTGEEQDLLSQFISRHGIKNISLLGYKTSSELAALIQNSMCTILPSQWYENFPYAALESFAYSKPIIASKIGGIPEIVDDVINGLLFESGNVAELRRCVDWIHNHQQQAREMGMAGRKKVESSYSPTKHIEKLAELYRQVISEKGGGSSIGSEKKLSM